MNNKELSKTGLLDLCQSADKACIISSFRENSSDMSFFSVDHINQSAEKLLRMSGFTDITNLKEILSPEDNTTIDNHFINLYNSKVTEKILCRIYGTCKSVLLNSFMLNEREFASIFYEIPEQRNCNCDDFSVIGRFKNIMQFRFTFEDYWRLEKLSVSSEFITGYTPQELIFEKSASWSKMIHDDDREILKASRKKAIFNKEEYSTEYRIITKSGETKYIWENGTGVYDKNGNIVSIEGLMHDITNRIEAELAMKAIEKKNSQKKNIDSLTRFAGGIAHDMNNQLMGISTIASLISMKTQNDDVAKNIEQIHSIIENSATLVDDLQKIALEETGNMEIVSLHSLMEKTFSDFSLNTENKHSIITDFSAERFFIKCHADKLKEALNHILDNSNDAMSGSGGALEITTQNIKNSVSDDYIAITIKDNGRGIKENYIGKLFDPFFTTKPHGNSRGLGLSIANGIVESHGGSITCSSEEGNWTSFHIELPVI